MSNAPTDADVTFECDLDAPPEKVWRALSEPELREAWLGESDVGRARVVGADAGSKLDLAWPTREGESRISFEIGAGKTGGTRLTIVHRAPVMIASVVRFRERARWPTMQATSWRLAA